MTFREEKDSMGAVQVPQNVYYGAQTQRAADHFQISHLSFSPSFIAALGMIKRYAAQVNFELGLIKKELADAVIQASEDVIGGQLNDQFIIDVFQTGSGTSTHMNVNEVIAGRANEIMTGKRGGRTPVHPNDHVNMGQSSNDVIPSSLHIAAVLDLRQKLFPHMKDLWESLRNKSSQFHAVKKIGRTHLQDAVPVTLGQEFSGYARQIELSMDRINATEPGLLELALGGTAVGTGLNTHPDFASRVIGLISSKTGIHFIEALNHFEAQSAQDAAVQTSGALKAYAVSLSKIANDVRWLSSGPRCGIGELSIPALQPGSSIMPGKVNPVIPEAVIQVAAQVIGNDVTVTLAGQSGNFELNTMLPLITYNLLQSIHLLSRATVSLKKYCIDGIEADQEKCSSNLEKSLALSTGLVPEIGYDRAAEISKEAFDKGKTVREIALTTEGLSHKKLNKILNGLVKGEE